MTPYSYEKLIDRYIAGETTEEEALWMEQYLNENPVEDSEVLVAEKDEIGRRIRQKLLANTTRKPVWSGWWWMAAASVILFTVLFWKMTPGKATFLPMMSTIWTSDEEGFAVSNTSRKPQRLTLEDGSVVILQPKSRISYPDHFGDRKRLVYLHGEAFFQVKRDVTKPFVVLTDNLATQVLGTSFNVRSYDGSGSIEVQVASGRVSVYENGDGKKASKNGFILTPNQKVVFDRESRKMELGIVKNPVAVAMAESRTRFEFSETPATEVLALLEKTYGIDIVVEGDVLRSCLFTGDLNDLPMFDQLDLICKAVNAEYERRGASLFISGEGCAN